MKTQYKLATFIVLMGLLGSSMHAELLVVKRGENGFSALDKSDANNRQAIANILLNYEWPMVIANISLTQEEQDELLNVHEPYAEELFIRKKLQQIDERYDVIFIPTSIYELFVMWWWQHQGKEYQNSYMAKMRRLELDDLLNITNESPKEIFEKIYGEYRNDNNIFYPDTFFRINSYLVAQLLTLFPECKEYASAERISLQLKTKSHQLATRLINDKFIYGEEVNSLDPSTIKPHGVLAQVIALEYEARRQNMGLLLRGTERVHHYRINVNEWFGLPASQRAQARSEIMGTTMRPKEESEEYSSEEEFEGESSIAEEKIAPYSISFGNSLFAGYLFDKDACAYSYLVEHGGYVLFVNKKDYIQHQLLNLFFIAPFPSLTALFEVGEYFHSRTKAAVSFSERGKELEITGLAGHVIDPFGVITTVRNPLLHAELFSKYLAENMHIISRGVNTNLTAAEQKIYDEKLQQEHQRLKQAQGQTAKYYKAMRTVKPAVSRKSLIMKKKSPENLKKRVENEKK